MTKLRFIGDIHGNMDEYNKIINASPYPSIQVGDMGVGFCDTNMIVENSNDNRHRFIRGNHDNPHLCKSLPNYISDGTVEHINGVSIYYIGGAFSIDRHAGTENIDWWADEELSYRDFQIIIDAYSVIKPDIMVTHDFPKSAAMKMFNKNHYHMVPNITSQAFDVMFGIHQPKYWIGGHWHMNKRVTYKKCKFVCVDINDYYDIDLDSVYEK